MAANQLVPQDIGSTDWTGYKAPAGGSHTGMCVITMDDGTTYTVAHSVTDVRQRTNSPGFAPGTPQWVAFDQPSLPVPIILNVGNILSTTPA